MRTEVREKQISESQALEHTYAVQITERFDQALVFATQLHRHQRRKVNEVPYVTHLLGVTALVLEDGGTEDEAIAALLHDAVEDQGGDEMRSHIRERFGAGVLTLVEGSTEPRTLTGERWRSHKQRYLLQVQQSCAMVQRVVLADKVHNGRSLLRNLHEYGEDTWAAFQGSPTDILWLHGKLIECFREARSGWLVDELSRIAQGLEQEISRHR